MPFYDFKKDFSVARLTEQQIVDILVKRGWTFISFNNNGDYDIKMLTTTGRLVTIEVKEDFTCKRTGNVGLEYSCRGKPSGINTSKADYYIYKIHKPDGTIHIKLIPTNRLKEAIKNKLFFRTVNGGDEGSNSLNYLFRLEVFLTL